MEGTFNKIMDNNERIFNTLYNTGTAWSVIKEPLFTQDGKQTNSYGLFRSDTNQWLSTVGKRYVPMQNAELAEIMVKIQQRFGGEIKGRAMGKIEGQKIYYQLSLDNYNINGDVLKRHITCLNSHNGSHAIGFGSTNTVISCSNTFHMAMKDLTKFRHTESASKRLEIAVKEFEKALILDENLMLTYKAMNRVPVDQTIIANVMQKVMKINPNDKVAETSTRKKNQLDGFTYALSKEFENKGNTLWGLFNGVTYYTNHIENKGIDNLMTGSGYKKNLIAFKTIEDQLIEKGMLINLQEV
tara:strand:+ start:4523 stop:5419 length:897 start_codon:yes stop_codon:yes gene_type:complete